MWPGCSNCGAAVPNINDNYCGGSKCIGKGGYFGGSSKHSPYTKKKLTRKMIKARRKKGRR